MAFPAMNQETLKQAKEDLVATLRLRERDPFPIFLRSWALTLLPLLLAFGLTASFPRWWAWLATAIVAGLTQNALGILMHEGSHYFCHRGRKASDTWCNLLVCLPIFNTVQGYRTPHFEHHRSSGEPEDPYFELYADYPSRRHLLKGFLLDFTGISALRKFVVRYSRTEKPSPKPDVWYAVPGLFLIQVLIAGLCFVVTGKWYAYFFLWVFPLMTIPVSINRLRTVVEHYPGLLGIKVNRTSLTGLIEYACIAPYGYENHLEHHLLPQVPYYDLDYAHRFLESHDVAFTENEVNSRGYLQTFFRLAQEMGGRQSSP